MATYGPTTIFWLAKPKIGLVQTIANTDVFKLMLVGNSQVLMANFAGSSGNCLKTDLTNEVSGTNYTAGGQALTGITYNSANGTTTFDAADVTWMSATLTPNPKYWVLYSNTATNKDLVCFGDCDTANAGGNPVSSTTFTVSFNPLGIFTES